MSEEKRYWMGSTRKFDDFGAKLEKVMIDGKTAHGPWAIMTPESWRTHGVQLGLGGGQMYEKQSDGRWLRVELSEIMHPMSRDHKRGL